MRKLHGGRPTPVHATHGLIATQDFTPLEFEEIVDLFKEFDKDKSGYIDEEELCEMMRALEMDHSLAKAKEMMLEIVLTQRSFGNFNMRRSSSSRDPATASTATASFRAGRGRVRGIGVWRVLCTSSQGQERRRWQPTWICEAHGGHQGDARADSEQKMNLNLMRSPRWRRHDRMSVHASSVPHRSPY